MKILVAYGTKKGSTGEVAEVVARELRERGFETDLRPASEVRGDLGAYSAAVLGGSLYVGRLHPDIQRLLKSHRSELAQVPVAIFAMGPGKMDPEDVASSRRQLESNLERVPELQPVAVAIFGGVIDPTKFRFPLNRMPASDARNWDAIREWAKALPAKLRLGEVGLARVGH